MDQYACEKRTSWRNIFQMRGIFMDLRYRSLKGPTRKVILYYLFLNWQWLVPFSQSKKTPPNPKLFSSIEWAWQRRQRAKFRLSLDSAMERLEILIFFRVTLKGVTVVQIMSGNRKIMSVIVEIEYNHFRSTSRRW